MTNYLSLINGKFQDTISVLDRGLSYGDGFFETMLWTLKPDAFNNQMFGVEFWSEHLNRMKKGCKLLKIKFPEIRTILQQREKILRKSHSKGFKSGVLKMIITRGVGGRGYKFEENMDPTIIFITFPLSKSEKKIYNFGVKARYCRNKISGNESLFGLKHLNRLDSVLARSEWKEEFFEGIFLDKKNNIIEGTMSNVFFIKKNKLFTPSIKEHGIDGVMRQVLVKKSKFFFDQIVVKDINKKMVDDFDQMFLTNSVIRVLPVRSLSKKKFLISKNLMTLVKYFNETEIHKKKKNLEID
tara:strand:- start:554 stop:1447 length:894 start_codon:yes stop_codon:yes gene_type:complete